MLLEMGVNITKETKLIQIYTDKNIEGKDD